MSAESGVEAVLKFLERNGFGQAEVAFRRDLLERNGCCPYDSRERDDAVGDFDYEKFSFPMSPPPPTLRIPAAGGVVVFEESERPALSDDGEEEFVSLGSSTSDLDSSEFTNPYGRRSRSSSADGDSEFSSSSSSSSSSSDRMSQFGTARPYHDYDLQNEQLYDEKEEGLFLTPSSFQALELEDKFITMPDPTTLCFDDNPKDLMNDTEKFLRNDDAFRGFKLKGADWTEWPGEDAEGLFLDHDSETKEMVRGSCKPSAKCEEGNDHVSRDWSRIEFDADFEKGESVDRLLAYDENDREGCTHCQDEALMAQNHDDDYEMFNLRIIHRRNRTGFEENKDLLIVLNMVIAGRYHVTEYLGSAAFSKVVQAHDLHTGHDVCLKIIKNNKDFFDQSLDEIKLLKLVNKHDPADRYHILRLYDYFYHQEHFFIVCELLRANLYEFQKFNEESGDEPYFTFSRLQIITRQCLEALEYLHKLGIIHCDLKPENILIKSYSRSQIKVIDLGSSCFKSDNPCLYVQSRSYRAPEVILGLPYDEKIDIWSLGCILAELCSGEVLFPDEPIAMILARVIGLIGPIELEMLENGQETCKYFTEEYDLYHLNKETDQKEFVVPPLSSLEDHLGASDLEFLDFLKHLLIINPVRRPTAGEALEHPWLSYHYSLSF